MAAISKSATYAVLISTSLSDPVGNELPLHVILLLLHFELGLQEERTVFLPNDGKVVFQAPIIWY
jgi:hypothetical protein